MGKQIHRVGVATSSPTLLLLLSLMIVITSDNISTIDGAADTTVLGRDCSAETWAQGDPYGNLLKYVFNELVTQTPNSADYVYSVTEGVTSTFAFASAQCSNTNLDPYDCGDCLNQCVIDLTNNCLYSVTATVTMVDCQMRYEKES